MAQVALPEKQLDPIPEYISVQGDDITYLVHRDALKSLIWSRIPVGLRDANSAEAQEPLVSLGRTAAKSFLRMALPMIKKKVPGLPEPARREDILKWALQIGVHIAVNSLALKEWRLNLEPCTTCENRVFIVRGLATKPDTNSETGV
jgi:hypothetical protein